VQGMKKSKVVATVRILANAGGSRVISLTRRWGLASLLSRLPCVERGVLTLNGKQGLKNLS